jgi:predicted Fe-S protein YdhL (DUF1289 family)
MLNLFLDSKVQSMYSVCMTEKKCQKNCKLDQDALVCLGCGRTLKEIIDAGNAHTKNGKKKETS